jgi:8-oxo-dGTP diphosphatase
MINVAAALLYDDNGCFLIAQRASGKLAGKWEFPGGKIETGETEFQAITREIKEELGIDVVPKKIVGAFTRRHFDTVIELVLVECDLLPDQKIISDGSHLSHEWIQFSESENYDFAPLDKEIIQFLQQEKSPE